ncbi:MAG: ribonuclease E/G [Caulobacteraceae bacterium]|nr:ribonuclease E/G [Caulobacteraceae bacterium]
MSKHMLIDAAHAEETRVAVVDGHRVEEFDFESRAKKQLRGNIYLARVTRVEPSLQAAFIEYGGNRHGFLAFDQIHPDYYQVPVADREALMAEPDDEEDRRAAEEEADDDEVPAEEAKLRRRLMRRYKIQEVVKRRQILLVQVVKEERGSKGAALTTYLSLAGRYCVLMPNTARGGGISRKITQATDRKRLKTIAQSLDVPHGMGVIIRTAGAKRTKQEITRDYAYLLRLWESIRETTLKSIAPALIYEEEDLVKRAVRDMYDKDIDAILVDGEAGWREARDFMRMIMPAHAKKVQLYQEPTPLFVKHRVEDALAAIHSPVVPLKSGGYLVINQTEALVAIDVNSGRSTKERNIEATALKTNLEAADEAARQLRLRDLAGLIVIDFIDMDESKNNRAVEKRLKDALDQDRARIQMGKISSFGLMELSRQRRRSGVLEGTTHVCEHCQGSGRVRSVESSALGALRAVEMEAVRGGGAVTLRAPTAVALYILNEKRAFLARLQEMNGLFVTVQVDDSLAHAEHAVERTETREHVPAPGGAVRYTTPLDDADEAVEEDFEDDADLEDEEEAELSEGGHEGRDDDRDGGRRGRRGRGRRRGGRRDEFEDADRSEADAGALPPRDDQGDEDGEGGRRRRRGRRGGRRGREGAGERDAYAWTRARTPNLDEPYVWFDPIEQASTPRLDRDERPSRADETRPAAREGGDELRGERDRERGERGGRRRRGRGRGRDRNRDRDEGFEPTLTAVPETPVTPMAAEAVTDDGPTEGEHSIPAEPVKRRRVRARKADAVEAPAAEPAVEAAPVPEAPQSEEPAPKPRRSRAKKPATDKTPGSSAVVEEAPLVAEASPAKAARARKAPTPALEEDPHQIAAPPERPKAGWWRRKG